MAFGRSLTHRFLDVAKTCSGHVRSGAGGSSVSGPVSRRWLLDSSECGIQRRPIVQAALPPDRISFPMGGAKLFDRIREITDDRLRRDVLVPPPPSPDLKGERRVSAMTVEEVRKVLKASQMEMVRSRLRAISESSISYSKFLAICSQASGAEQGGELARSLDDSGAVIVLGNFVFLRPDQVAKAIEGVIPRSMAPKEELMELEQKKAMIDKEAETRVRRELWGGLGFLVAQTAWFMRLTFWDLSWDVMEPICFYVTSSYFMAGYIFFMRTSTEPSFEGFFKRRFASKQKLLMKAYNFDLCRFNELMGVCCSPISPLLRPYEVKQASTSCCDCDRRNALVGAVY